MRRRTTRFAILAALLLCSGTSAGSEIDGGLGTDGKRATVVASVDPALLATAPLAAPLVFAHGNLGIPRVITWANLAGTSGIAWGTTSAIAAGNAYVSYNGTNMILNVPTGDGFQFLVNGDTTTFVPIVGEILIDGDTADVATLTLQGAVDQSAVVFVVENSTGTDQFTVSNAGAVVAAGTVTGSAMIAPSLLATVSGFGIYNVGSASLPITFDSRVGVLIDGLSDAPQLVVQGHSTQTTLPFVVENSAGTDVATISNLGAMVLSSSLTVTGDGNFSDALEVGGTGTFTGDLTLNGGAGALGFGAGETIVPADGTLNVTGDIVMSATLVMNSATPVIQNNASTVFSFPSGARTSITPPATFGVDIETTGSKVACDATNRGSIFYEAGGAGVADVWYGCSKQAAGDTYAWRDLATPVP